MGGTNRLPVLLFDGVCNLCNRYVRFVADRDPAGTISFASLQSTAAEELLARHGVPAGYGESIVVVDQSGIYFKSDAVIRVAHHLGGAYGLVRGLRIVPKSIRDRVYDVVATHRYRLFGRRDRCSVPDDDFRSRFFD